MRFAPARHRAAFLIALTGVAVSVLTAIVHARLAAGGYTSFCNLGGIVNCDAVIVSRYGTFLGVPVAVWSALTFGAGALLAVRGAFGSTTPGWTDLVLLGLVSWSLGFALVLLIVSVRILGHLCLLCLTMDAVIVAWFVAVAPLASRFDTAAPRWWLGRGTARAVTALGLVLAVAGGTWAATTGRQTTPGSVAPSTVAEVRARDPKFYRWYTDLPVRPTDQLSEPSCHSRGPANAQVAIVEFSDFQCPYCGQAFRDLRDLMRQRGDVRLVFRHYPLDAACNSNVKNSVHPDACLAACAAECAGTQGRFWEYHDVLFENNERLERTNLLEYAKSMGLDMNAFRACLDDPATRARVGEDVQAGTRVGVSSTPTMFINGRTIEGAMSRAHYDYALILEGHPAHAAGGTS